MSDHYHTTTIGSGTSLRKYVTCLVPNWDSEQKELLVVHESHDSRGNVAHWSQFPYTTDTDTLGSHHAYVQSREATPLDHHDE